MRSYIRHPTDIPIDYNYEGEVSSGAEHLTNVSYGGLSFNSSDPLPPGSQIRVSISAVQPLFQASGRVVWCRPTSEGFHIGVQFTNGTDAFKVRMVEQACYIERYKKRALETEGRNLSGEQAAMEWIALYAKDFPNPDAA